jgi:hypothetical protein
VRHVQRVHLTAPVVLALLAGCGAPVAPTDVEEPLLSFFTRVVFGFPTLATTAETPRDAEIVVSGLVVAPTSSYLVEGDLESPRRGELTVTIKATRQSGGQPFPTQNYYAATIQRLAPGSYAVRVLHVIERDTWDTTLAFNRTVQVR